MTQLGLFAAQPEPAVAPQEEAIPQKSLSAATQESTSPKWKELLKDEFEAPYFLELKSFIKSERAAGKTIFPQDNEIFNALGFTPLEQVKVVIIGQDPYHGVGQAHGLCFSVRPGTTLPPSLQNIYKELAQDLGVAIPKSGYLEKWARQGVLLLNAVLTVERGQPASHQAKGWERFTDKIIHIINEQRKGVVFMLWGAYAQKKCEFIDRSRHLVLMAPHPSPFSANRGFFGSKHFSKANQYLKAAGIKEIDWSLS